MTATSNQLNRVKSELPPLSECAVLINVNIGGLSETRVHKAATAALAKEHGSESREAKVTFNLISKTSLAAIKRCATELREFLKTYTLPYVDPHYRICAIERLDFVERGIRRITKEFNRHAQELATKIQGFQEDQRHRLGSLAPNPKDYLTAEDIRARFKVTFNRQPILEGGGDWRFNVSNAKVEAVLTRIRLEEARKHKAATEAVSGAVFDVAKVALDEVSDKLRRYTVEEGDDGKVERRHRWTSKLVERIHELAQRLPVLNVQGDPRVVALIAQVDALSKSLKGASDNDLREDEDARLHVADEADKILEALEGYGG